MSDDDDDAISVGDIDGGGEERGGDEERVGGIDQRYSIAGGGGKSLHFVKPQRVQQCQSEFCIYVCAQDDYKLTPFFLFRLLIFRLQRLLWRLLLYRLLKFRLHRLL